MDHGSPDENVPVVLGKSDATDTTHNEVVIIPRCHGEYTTEEAKRFINEIMSILKRLTTLHSMTTLYRTAKQLSRTFTQCRDLQSYLAQYLIEIGYPALAVRYIKQLNNKGVFSNDGTWYSSFYFYSTVWNYTDISHDFSTAVAVAGLSHLLNLNMGHPPYMANVSSKNVYFLFKASLSILHNIVKVPGNRDMGQYASGRDALLNILNFDGEESLKCVSSLCLAHTILEEDVGLVLNRIGEGQTLIQLLLGYIYSANVAPKRRYHGFPMLDLMTALSALIVNQPIQPIVLVSDVRKPVKSAKAQSRNEQNTNCLDFLLKLTDNFLHPALKEDAEKEANAAIRAIHHLMFNEELKNKSKMKSCVNHMLDLSRYPTVLERTDRSLFRVLENIVWQSYQDPCPKVFPTYALPEPSHLGPIIMSYSSINRLAVAYFVNQLRAAGLPVWNDPEAVVVDHKSSQELGLSALAGTVMDQKGWLQCLNQATVMIACLTDAYRLNPGCRSEIENFISTNTEEQPKVLIYILMPPKFTPNGWISQLPGVSEALNFTHKRTFIWTLQRLVAMAGRPYGITVANEPLDPITYHSGESHKGYISIEDLNGLKSSSIFLTSESEQSKPSAITQTAEQMISKGSPRLYGMPAIQNHTSSSTTLTPFHSSGSEPPSQNYGDFPPVASIPSTNISDSRQTGNENEGQLVRQMQPSIENIVESTTLETSTIVPIDSTNAAPETYSYKPISGNSKTPENISRNGTFENATQKQVVSPDASPLTDVVNTVDGLNEFCTKANCQVTDSRNVNDQIKSNTSKCLTLEENVSPTKSPTISASLMGKPPSQSGSKHTDKSTCKLEVPFIEDGLLPTASESHKTPEVQDIQATMSGIMTPHKSSQKSTGCVSKIEDEVKRKELNEVNSQERALDAGTSTQSTKNTADTMDKGTVSADHSKTLPAQFVSEKKPQSIHDSSVQTLSIMDDIRTIPTFASAMTTPVATYKHDKAQNYMLSPGTFLTPFSYDIHNPIQRTASQQDIVRPYVRNWTIEQVTEWLNAKGLQHLPHKLCGALDGILLSQLICLRHWAPEYFAKSIRSELGLNFIDGLRLVEAMEELTKRSK